VQRHAGEGVVACLARMEWAVIRVPSSPAASAWAQSGRAMTSPDSGVRLMVLALIRVNSGPGTSPPAVRQAASAAMG
jgi:hypothetical protein